RATALGLAAMGERCALLPAARLSGLLRSGQSGLTSPRPSPRAPPTKPSSSALRAGQPSNLPSGKTSALPRRRLAPNQRGLRPARRTSPIAGRNAGHACARQSYLARTVRHRRCAIAIFWLRRYTRKNLQKIIAPLLRQKGANT